MQVALNEESEYAGGRLVLATTEGLLWPSLIISAIQYGPVGCQ